MADSSKILEGVFAISKPPSLSSAQVIRDLQQHFKSSKLFAPLIDEQSKRFAESDRHQAKRRRRDNDSIFKMGHGGTLDPMAVGVLIIGLGRGTKHLQNFLGCTKQYDTTILFGKSTDTYDICGKIVGEATYNQITKTSVEEKLARFRGNIKQVPPVYSALKINGMKLYEYARSGKELPRELESRDMQVDKCEMIEYFEGGKHDFRWPATEVSDDEKAAVRELMQHGAPSLQENKQMTSSQQAGPDVFSSQCQRDQLSPQVEQKTDHLESSTALKEPAVSRNDVRDTNETINKHGEEADNDNDNAITKDHIIPSPKEPSLSSNAAADGPDGTTTVAVPTVRADSPDPKANNLPPTTKAALHTHDHTANLSATPAPSPAARISLTVSSGFYVRSFAHDLGLSLSSYGIMAELTRSRQGDFVIPALSSQFPDLVPAITYADLEAGEDVWAPKLSSTLEKWMADNPLPGEVDADGNVRPDDRDRDNRREWKSKGNFRYGGGGGRGGGGGWKGKHRGGGGGSGGGGGGGGGKWRGGIKRE